MESDNSDCYSPHENYVEDIPTNTDVFGGEIDPSGRALTCLPLLSVCAQRALNARDPPQSQEATFSPRRRQYHQTSNSWRVNLKLVASIMSPAPL